MQALLFAALLANARAHVDDDRFFAPVAATLLGLLLFLRFDAVLGIAGVLAGLALGVFAGQRPRAGLRGHASPRAAALAALYMLGPMRAYAILPIVFSQQPAVVAVRCAGRCAALAGAGRDRARRARAPSCPPASVRWTPAVVIAGAVGVAGALRAVLPAAGREARRDYDAYALRMFANFYLTLPALARRADRLRAASRAARSGAIRRSFATVAIFSLLLLLQDPDRARALLDGAPVPAGRSCPARCCFARGGGARRRRAADGTAPAPCGRASASCSSRCSRSQYAARQPAAARPRRVRGHHPAARAARRRRSETTTC